MFEILYLLGYILDIYSVISVVPLFYYIKGEFSLINVIRTS